MRSRRKRAAYVNNSVEKRTADEKTAEPLEEKE